MVKPIVAGVDATQDGAWAGAVAHRLAERVGTQCFIVHAVREVMLPPAGAPGLTDEAGIRSSVLHAARDQILARLRGNVPEACLASVDVRMGRPARVIQEVVAERDAGLIVVGGKRHHVLGRWLGGSAVLHVVRLADVPVLVTTAAAAQIERMLVAVDLSEAAKETIAAAEQFAALLGARLRFVHVVEEIPFAPEVPAAPSSEELFRAANAVLETDVWPTIGSPDAERVVRRGSVRAEIEREAAEWTAQLVVVGSHGKGRIDRMLLGSVTEGLIRDLPASLLVIPVAHSRR